MQNDLLSKTASEMYGIIAILLFLKKKDKHLDVKGIRSKYLVADLKLKYNHSTPRSNTRV